VNIGRIGLKEPSATDPSLRLDIELKSKYHSLKWASTGNIDASCSSTNTSLESNADGCAMYNINGLQIYQRTNYIDLNSKSLNETVNTTLHVKLVSIQIPLVNAKKGADKNPVLAEETLIELAVPLIDLLKSKDGKFLVDGIGSNWTKFIHEKVVAESCILTMELTLDNCLAEYILGCCFINLSNIKIGHLPSTILLHLPVEKDSKANKKVTPAEIKSKYLESIAKLVQSQDKIASYSIQINGSCEVAPFLSSFIPVLETLEGVVSYDFEAANEVIDEEFKKESTDFWSITWGSSSTGFIHRSDIREFNKVASSLPVEAFTVPVSLCKTVTAEGQATEGNGPTIMSGLASLIQLSRADTLSFETELLLSLELPAIDADSAKQGKSASKASPKPVHVAADVTSSEPAIGSILVEVSKPLIKSVVIPQATSPVNLESIKERESAIKPANNSTPIEDLQEEIKKSITSIASEYAIAFPTHLSSSANKNERKAEFMQILNMKGTLADIKVALKPKLQQVLWWRYGPRGHALGRDHTKDLTSPPSLPLNSYLSTTGDVELDNMLSDLFVMLTKQCNIVLNRMYKETVIDSNKALMDNQSGPETVLDEVESLTQKMIRLLNQATNYEANQQYESAEQVHLERLQLALNKGNDSGLIYADYGGFCLRASSKLFMQQDKLLAARYFEKGCEALRRSFHDSNNVSNETMMLHLSCLMENLFTSNYAQSGKDECIEDLFYSRLIFPQLGMDGSNESNIDGYESDDLVPIDPMGYILLATFYSLNKQPVKARRSFLLAAKSFIGKSCLPDVSTHGTPRRTLVYLLAQQSTYFAKHGFHRLLQESISLAFSTENDVTKKIEARGLPSLTVPFIRHRLLHAQALSLVNSDPVEALSVADKCLHSADCDNDKVNGWLLLAQVQQVLNPDASILISLYFSALEVIGKSESIGYNIVPLEDYSTLGKLLIQSARYNEAVTLLSHAIPHYPTAGSLLLMSGVAYLRLEQYYEADQALQHANILDNRNPEVWAYYTLLCLYSGCSRIDEASSALYQTLRLELRNSSLLRELAVCYLAIDKLAIAEDLIRRCMSIESSSSSNGKPHPATRKLFADILAGQNQTSEAIEEYKMVLESSVSDPSLQRQAAETCLKLSSALGRFEDAKSVEGIIQLLNDEGISQSYTVATE
jgi:tetratricopeptide (TPR) repeat protein